MRQGPVATLIGAGGLGGPLAHALAAAGPAQLDQLHIFDGDVVEASNLHRQVQFALADLGQPKAELLAARLARYGITAIALPRRWTAETAVPCDLLLEGSDDPATKFAAADWAAQRALPSVIAGALGLGGNVFVGAPGAACFRCLFEAPPEEAPTCADAGVLGPVVAQIAALAAGAAARLLRGELEHSEIWIIDDALAGRPPRRLPIERRADCSGCGKATA